MFLFMAFILMATILMVVQRPSFKVSLDPRAGTEEISSPRRDVMLRKAVIFLVCPWNERNGFCVGRCQQERPSLGRAAKQRCDRNGERRRRRREESGNAFSFPPQTFRVKVVVATGMSHCVSCSRWPAYLRDSLSSRLPSQPKLCSGVTSSLNALLRSHGGKHEIKHKRTLYMIQMQINVQINTPGLQLIFIFIISCIFSVYLIIFLICNNRANCPGNPG